MATLDDVALIAAELPEVTEGERHGNRTWFVGGKAFAWDRAAGSRTSRASRYGGLPGQPPAYRVYQARGPAL